jgi:hypothetical protein
MKFERFEFIRVNLGEIGRPGFDLLVIPELDDNGNQSSGCYLSRRGYGEMKYMFGLCEDPETAANIAIANLPDYPGTDMDPDTVLYILKLLANARNEWFDNMQTCQKYVDHLKLSGGNPAEVAEAEGTTDECARRMLDISRAEKELANFFGLPIFDE